MWLVEVPLQVGKYHLALIINAFSDSCAVYYALTMRLGMGRGSQPDLLPFACQRTYHTSAVYSRGRDAADG